MKILPIKFNEMKESSDNFFIELYEIELRSGTLRFAACDTDITFAGKQYLSMPIERGGYTQTVDSKLNNLELKIGNVDHAITRLLMTGIDFRGTKCSILRIMYPHSIAEVGDTPAIITEKSKLYMYVFSGTIDAPYVNNREFKVQLIATSPQQDAPSRKCQLTCNAVFGDIEACGVVKVIRNGVIESGSNNGTIVNPTHRTEPDGFWTNGIVTVNYESRKIERYENKIIYLDYPFVTDVSDNYTVEQGCDKTFKTCKDRFNNGRNFSGFPSIPFEYVVKT